MSQVNCQNHPTMKQEFFKNLPSEIVIDILSRLPVRSVISCKCVQKSWLHLVDTREFVKSHLSKSTPGLITCESGRESYKLFEIEDELDVKHHDLHYKPVTKFKLNNVGMVMGSVDGLIFLCKRSTSKTKLDALCICNPITRDYININCLREFNGSYNRAVTYGFGSSKITGQYKLVRISHDCTYNPKTVELLKTSEVEFHVYTLGTGLWRRSVSCASLACIDMTNICDLGHVVFENGNLHWLVLDLDRRIRISCFDLETERFSTLSTPPPFQSRSLRNVHLFVWGGCLGLSDNTLHDEIVIWSMKGYGVEKSWTKKIVISNVPQFGEHEPLKSYPMKVFKDGDILIKWNEYSLVYYSSKTKTVEEIYMFRIRHDTIDAFLHTPSFLSLKSFGLDPRRWGDSGRTLGDNGKLILCKIL